MSEEEIQVLKETFEEIYNIFREQRATYGSAYCQGFIDALNSVLAMRRKEK